MSYYGNKPFDIGFTVHKRRVAGRGIYRFGNSQAQLAYKADDLTPVEVIKEETGTSVTALFDTVVVTLLNQLTPTPVTIENAELLHVVEEHTIPEGHYAVVVEGAASVTDEQGNKIELNANTDIPLVKPGVAISGICTLVQFIVK